MPGFVFPIYPSNHQRYRYDLPHAIPIKVVLTYLPGIRYGGEAVHERKLRPEQIVVFVKTVRTLSSPTWYVFVLIA